MSDARASGTKAKSPPAEDLVPVAETIREFVRRYVALSDVQSDAVALWIIHTHAFEAAESTPYLRISSVGPGSGKTRLLEILELLTANPWLTGRVTGPALVRKVGADHPTLLLDETDALFTGGNASQQMLRGILNSGYRLGGKVAYAVGRSYEELDVFCPKAFAGIGGLPTTIADRSIPVLMKKRSSFDPVERLRQRDVKLEAKLPRALAARFATMHLEALTMARPEIPRELDDRAADVWEPLLAIADALGGDWPQRSRHAAIALCAERKDAGTDSMTFRLLAACRDVFDALGAERLKTVTLLEELRLTGDWDYLEGRPLDARTLADALRPCGIAPGKLRFGRQALQGYARSSFFAAWAMLEGVPAVPEQSKGKVTA